MSASICFMPGDDSSPHCGPSEARRKVFSRMGASWGEAAWAVTNVGAWPNHWGVKPSLAAVPRIGPVFDGQGR